MNTITINGKKGGNFIKAIIKQIEECSFIGKSDSNHYVAIDTPKESFGSDAAVRPMELVLIRSENYPKVFTKIHMEFVFYGEKINPVHAERAIELSAEKYCSVSAMPKASVQITRSYKILNEKL